MRTSEARGKRFGVSSSVVVPSQTQHALRVAAAFADGEADLLVVSGGLAPWQCRRAEAMLRARLGGRVELALLARECRLSARHFSRAFRHSFGTSPYRWLVERRVERARQLLAESVMPIAEIAVASGFADQSHFTRVFSRHVGASPAAWRRRVVP